MKHWSQGKCGPDSKTEQKIERLKARKEAHSLTQKAVITEKYIKQLENNPHALKALCQYLGVTVIAEQNCRQVSWR